MAQAVMSKASPVAISLGVGLIVGGLLEIIGINNNKVISGIPNRITITSNLWYVVKKSREATFMRIAGFSAITPAACHVTRESVLGLDV